VPKYTERAAGIYRCTFTGTDERDMMNPETGQEEPRYIWKFQEVADPTSAGQLDKITGTYMKSPNSNAYKIASGLMGRKLQPDDDTDTCIGQVYDVVYGPNQAGNLTITSVVRAGGSPGGLAAGITSGPGGNANVTPSEGDALPF
jgi:hypothetical protein